MPLRLIELVVPTRLSMNFEQQLSGHEPLSVMSQDMNDGKSIVRVVVATHTVEAVLDKLTREFGSYSDFSVIVLPVLARVPRNAQIESIENEKKNGNHNRLSRDELHQHLTDASSFNRVHISMLVLATIIAAIGILSNSSTVIIGAMVIAPMFAPSVALSLANLLADRVLAFHVIKLVIIDIFVVVAISWLIGWVFGIDKVTNELTLRTSVSLSDVITALASGAAGVLGLATGLASALVGVMVAVALLPPLVTAGLLLGDGMTDLAWKAILLFLSNFICINLTGIVTLWLLGIRPAVDKDMVLARKFGLLAFVVWMAFLIAVVIAILFFKT